jgi:hypothetical protein
MADVLTVPGTPPDHHDPSEASSECARALLKKEPEIFQELLDSRDCVDAVR